MPSKNYRRYQGRDQIGKERITYEANWFEKLIFPGL